MKQFLTVGKIINTHGIKGEVKVQSTTDDLSRFRSLKSAYIDDIKVEVCGCKLQPNKAILKIKGIDTIEDAQRLKNKEIKVERQNAVKLKRDSYFAADIVNCDVYDENGLYLGKVNDIIYTGSNEVYCVEGESEILVPALKSIVMDIDIENNKIIIKPLDVWQ